MGDFTNRIRRVDSYPYDAKAPSGPGLFYYRSFTITVSHTTLGRAPLDQVETNPSTKTHGITFHLIFVYQQNNNEVKGL